MRFSKPHTGSGTLFVSTNALFWRCENLNGGKSNLYLFVTSFAQQPTFDELPEATIPVLLELGLPD